jgi:putative Ca2+/H+ antiporter (TMEM165/GDT1 family)
MAPGRRVRDADGRDLRLSTPSPGCRVEGAHLPDPEPTTGAHRLHAFLLSFGVVFLAELGDKSQLMALAFATRYRALTVLIAVSVATLLVHAGSVLVGSFFALALPTNVIQVVAGLAFFGFAAWTIRGDTLGDEDERRAQRAGRWAVLTIGTAFFLAELGDKTMLATITLATTEEPIGTWLGSTAGMVAADAIAIAVGAFFGTRLPERAITVFAAGAFALFGALLVAEGLGLTPR